MEAAITKEDCIITGYREHCTHLARGDTPYRIIAEMMSRATGSTKGKGGSMHYYNRKNNFYGGHGIVGAQVSLGTGIAFALKYQNKPNVCYALYGDGSANQGQVYESSNMAGNWKLPIVYVIENNHYGMGTSEDRSNFYRPIYAKFRGFGGLKAQGNDVFSVREASKFTKNYALQSGPIFLELDTYRYQGHSMSDPGITYRTKEEVQQYRDTKDCISKIRNYILGFKVATEKDLKDIDREIKDRILEDVEKVKNDPYPDTKELFTNIMVDELPYIRNVEFPDSVFNEHKQ
jgi:pyruvate dehydrogenase E1 component alpha subunit